MVKGTFPIPPDPEARTSDDIEASKILAVRAAAKNRIAPFKSAPGNGANVGGKTVSGGAKIRGGRA